MSKVYGNLNLSILVDVDGNSERLGLLQANYKLNPHRQVKWKLSCVDSFGHEEVIDVCDCENVDLTEFVD